MFASKITKEVEVGDERVTVRKLSYAALDRAREVRARDGAVSLRNYGGELVKVFRSEEFAEAKAKQAADPRAARYNAFDRGTVLVAGIASWTVGDVTPERIGDLDDESAQLIFEAIVDLSLPPLDLRAVEAARKND